MRLALGLECNITKLTGSLQILNFRSIFVFQQYFSVSVLSIFERHGLGFAINTEGAINIV